MRYLALLADTGSARNRETEVELPDGLELPGPRIAVTIDGRVWVKFAQILLQGEREQRRVLYLRPALGSVEAERRHALASEADFVDLTHRPQPSPRR